jgi:hypothetical protein
LQSVKILVLPGHLKHLEQLQIDFRIKHHRLPNTNSRMLEDEQNDQIKQAQTNYIQRQ